MDPSKRGFVIGALSGIIGGVFGALSGSNSMLVVGSVAAVISLIAAFGLKGLIR